jgi:hypothetical protein
MQQKYHRKTGASAISPLSSLYPTMFDFGRVEEKFLFDPPEVQNICYL